MGKLAIVVLLILTVGFVGFFVYQDITKKSSVVQKPINTTSPIPKTESLSPIFDLLSTWVPDATWDTPKQTSLQTPYGNLSGMEADGKMTDQNTSLDNFGNEKTMTSLAYEKDMSFSADGPGASNWGYIKTDNGKKQVVVFRYSTNHLLGPESTSPPFTNLSVFVSDPFTSQ